MQSNLSRRFSPATLTLGGLALCALGTLTAAPLGPPPTPAQGSCHGSLPACVPMNDCALYTFRRPALPPGQRWALANGGPVGFEEDFVCDDFLGACGVNGESATILICNHAGRLLTHPGAIELNGTGEVGNPEIFVRWTSVYTAQVTNSGLAVGGSISGGSSQTSTVVRYAWHDSAVVEVRPC